MNHEQSQNPIDKAKALIEAKKNDRFSKEELEKQEENTRLTLLFQRIENLKEELSKIEEKTNSLNTQAREHSLKYDNQTSGMKQAVEVLKSNPETASMVNKDKPGAEVDHIGRIELAEQVFGEAKDERRMTKQELKEVQKDIKTFGKEKEGLLKQIEELVNSPDGQKLKKLKKQAYIDVVHFEDDYSVIGTNQEKKYRYALYKEYEKINNFVKERSKDIEAVKESLNIATKEMLVNIQNVFASAENSGEYQPDLHGKIDFDKYKKQIPNPTGLEMEIYSYDSRDISFPQIQGKNRDYQSGLLAEIGKDIEEIRRQKNVAIKEARQRGKGLFSNGKKYQTLAENLKKKEDLLYKISQSISEKIRNFQEVTMENNGFIVNDEKKIPSLIGRYIQKMDQDVYNLRNEGSLPGFKKAMTTSDLFKWAKQNDIPVDYQKAFEDKQKLDAEILKAKKEYELLAGEGKALDIRT